MTETSDPPLDASLDLYVRAALGKKALDLVILDVRQLTSITDAFIICSGRSNRQVTAIAEYIQTSLKKKDIKPLSVEPVRDFYDLESLWNDAEKIQADSFIKPENESD